MTDIVVSQQVTKEEIVKAYNKGLHIQGLADKFNIPVSTVNAIVDEAFPQDVEGDFTPEALVEGENPVVAPVVTEPVETPAPEVTSTKNTKA